MAKFRFEVGSTFEAVTPEELGTLLQEHRAIQLRDLLTGVKLIRSFYGLGQVSPNATSFTVPGPASGYVWAIMNVGVELTASSPVRLYHMAAPPGGSPIGANRLVTQTGNITTPFALFAKGQFMIHADEFFTVSVVTGGTYILSVYVTAIQVPAEREGELYL